MVLKSKSRLLEVVCGIPVYSFFGADGEQDANPPAGSENNGGDNSPDDPDDPDDDDDEDDDDDDGETVAKAKWRKTDKQSRRRARELKQANADKIALQQQLDDIARKNNTEADNLKKDHEKSTERVTHLEKLLTKNLLETAILKDPKRVWHDVTQTIAALPSDDVTVNLDSGEVEGLEEALADVAKEKPFLVKETKGKKKQEQNGSGESGPSNQQRNGASGTNPGGQPLSGNAQTNRNDLVKRIPALRGR